MSKIADEVCEGIKKLFPHETLIFEHYIYYKNAKLFFDIYIKSLGILIEIQGMQHFKFVKHFHGTKEKFYAQKRRDNFKIEYCAENNLTLAYFYDKIDIITEDLILERLYEALDE